MTQAQLDKAQDKVKEAYNQYLDACRPPSRAQLENTDKQVNIARNQFVDAYRLHEAEKNGYSAAQVADAKTTYDDTMKARYSLFIQRGNVIKARTAADVAAGVRGTQTESESPAEEVPTPIAAPKAEEPDQA